ncbi:hypothetical protein [Gracilibacillus sp. YIM 98692]|uniref:hypothetical protein n=1 Tax=Gracilibacillus sp. YIM 98692 TaxID=2663532 RepID=UPI0013D88643|nr:hypothetical protein [Gracilibacillus sp. YIM 98692]
MNLVESFKNEFLSKSDYKGPYTKKDKVIVFLYPLLMGVAIFLILRSINNNVVTMSMEFQIIIILFCVSAFFLITGWDRIRKYQFHVSPNKAISLQFDIRYWLTNKKINQSNQYCILISELKDEANNLVKPFYSTLLGTVINAMMISLFMYSINKIYDSVMFINNDSLSFTVGYYLVMIWIVISIILIGNLFLHSILNEWFFPNFYKRKKYLHVIRILNEIALDISMEERQDQKNGTFELQKQLNNIEEKLKQQPTPDMEITNIDIQRNIKLRNGRRNKRVIRRSCKTK